MLIINKYNAVTTAPVVATNDNDPITGNQSTKWIGANPTNQGVAGNSAAGAGLTDIEVGLTYADQVISKLVSIKISGTLTAAQDNFIRIPTSALGLAGSKIIQGGTILGVYDPTPTGNNPSWINIGAGLGLISVINDALILKIPNNNQALYQGKVANILIFYSNN